jgi:EAL domain-containing protein (putative c-di-GMP-specific phosphodiesterase class I)/GAF domain-containing protein
VLPWGQPTDIASIPPAAASTAELLEVALKTSGCDGVCIYWYNQDSNVLVPLSLSDELRAVQLPVLHSGQGIIGTCFASRRPVYLDNAYEAEQYAHAYAAEIGMESAFAIPIVAGDAVLGVLGGGCRHPHRIASEARSALEDIAVAIAQSFAAVGSIFVEAQVNRAEYALVSSLIRDYATDADFDLTSSRIAQVALTLLGSDYAVISRQEPNLSHTYHGARAVRSPAWTTETHLPNKRTDEIDALLDAGEIVIVGCDEIADPVSGFEHSRSEGARTVMLVPITIQRHRIGILVAGWRLDVSISPRLRHLAQTLAGHAAIAIAESQREHVFSGRAIEARRLDDSIARHLNRALALGHIELEYQPIFDAKTGSVVLLEVLSRWPGAPAGYERPDQFVLFAEDRGIIGALTDYVVERAAREWPQAERVGARLAINVSMRNFEEPSFAKRTLATLARHGIDATCFTIELTETSRLVDRHNAVATSRKLAKAGMQLSIDDFGEGYAALSYLKTFRATALKIDRRYVTNVATDSYDFSIVRSVTELAHSLGVAVVAEGIETTEALQVVKALGCDMVQGYVCARPMPVEKLAAYFTT